ncbi:hypothetical protein GCM10010377_65580 [Streptomyces viridiviolaceus]|nr:hypothetical protein GCM10010377_65580 [Streptomyces viridiviolaceus]
MFEQQLPARVSEPQRLRSASIVHWGWPTQTAVATALIITALALATPRGGSYFSYCGRPLPARFTQSPARVRPPEFHPPAPPSV